MSEAKVAIAASRHLKSWLADMKIGLAFTTKRANKLFLNGVQSDANLSIFERTFQHCRGLWSDGQTLWVSILYQLWRLENVLVAGQTSNGFDVRDDTLPSRSGRPSAEICIKSAIDLPFTESFCRQPRRVVLQTDVH